MFDVGFWELTLITVIALLVVGPERLPRLARTAGLWLGKARRMVSSVKEDIDREIKAEELKRILNEQSKLPGLQDIVEETSRTVSDAKRLAEDAGSVAKPNVGDASGAQPAAASNAQAEKDSQQQNQSAGLERILTRHEQSSQGEKIGEQNPKAMSDGQKSARVNKLTAKSATPERVSDPEVKSTDSNHGGT